MDEGRTQGRFRLATSRRQELTMQQELDDVAKKSMLEFVKLKEMQQQLESEDQINLRKFAGEFIPHRPANKRKSKPLDQNLTERKDEVDIPKKPCKKVLLNPQASTLNSSRGKIPDKTILTPTPPKIIDGKVNVVLTGASATIPKLPIKEPVVKITSPTREPTTVDCPVQNVDDATQMPMKPAIIGRLGTTQLVKLSERPLPASKPMTHLKVKPPLSATESSQSLGSSFMSVDIDLLDDVSVRSTVASANQNARQKLHSNSSTMLSVMEMLEDAKKVASPDLRMQGKKPQVKPELIPGLKMSSVIKMAMVSSRLIRKKKKLKEKEVPKDADRTVDEIIRSLREQAASGSLSEADRQIQEIMNRVVDKSPDEITEKDAAVAPADVHPIKQYSPAEFEHQLIPVEEETEPELMEDPKPVSISSGGLQLETSEEVQIPLEPDLERDLESVITAKHDILHEEQSYIDITQALNDLNASSEVVYEDIINVNGGKALIQNKPQKETKQKILPQMSLLSTWRPIEKQPPHVPGPTKNGIHHFCTQNENIQLPDHFRGVWRRYHVPSKYDAFFHDNMAQDAEHVDAAPSTPWTDLGQRQADVAQRILDDAQQIPANDEPKSLKEWREQAQQMFSESELTVDGKNMKLLSDETYLYWTPAPPKWDVPPSVVKSHLFPLYHGSLPEQSLDPRSLDQEPENSDDEADIHIEADKSEDYIARKRSLRREYSSARDLTNLTKDILNYEEKHTPVRTRNVVGKFTVIGTDQAVNTELIDERLNHILRSVLGDNFVDVSVNLGNGGLVEYTIRVKEDAKPDLSGDISAALLLSVKRGLFSDMDIQRGSIQVQDEICTKADLMKRHLSVAFSHHAVLFPYKMPGRREVSDLAGGSRTSHYLEDVIIRSRRRHKSAPTNLPNDDDMLLIYQDYNTVMKELRQQRDRIRKLKQMNKHMSAIADTMPDTSDHHSEAHNEHDEEKTPAEMKKRKFSFSIKDTEKTPAELALEAGRSYVLLPKMKKKKRLEKADLAMIERIEEFVSARPRVLKRCLSVTIDQQKTPKSLRVPLKVRARRKSCSGLLTFQEYKKKEKFDAVKYPEEREWVRQIWDQWFEEAYPEDTESEWGDVSEDALAQSYALPSQEDKPRRNSSVASTVYSENIELEPVVESEDQSESIKLMREEVQTLNTEIATEKQSNAFNLCRRGAILRKLGQIKSALADLNKAIEMEPSLLDAYWHRHLVYILLNKKQAALDDINIYIKHRPKSDAFKSRAQLYYSIDDITMSIVNYTLAIKYNPNDDQAFFSRAQLYEEREETLLAMDDYMASFKLNNHNTDALFRHGMHYYNSGNWLNAIDDFSQLLKNDPQNAQAHLLRGQTYSKIKQWNRAVEDYSACIHLNPRHPKAFYYRGCLLRKLHPKKALQDFSVSLLLDDSEDNLLCFMHRAILYNETGRHEDAIPDFEAVLKLNKDNACAHVSLGLIYMQKMLNHQRAIKKFTSAIKSDPTYLRAYICRAEAYTQIHQIKDALLDITRAIHLRPDQDHLYMYRGQLVLKLGSLELAAYCVKHAAELRAGFGQSPTQTAIVQTFLKNYDKAIEALEGATRVKPVPPLFMLLGKTRMKAGKWKDAVQAFEAALDLVKPWHERQSWPLESAKMFYLVGVCHLEMRDYFPANTAFNSAIQVNKNMAEAHYWHGMTRIKLKQSKGIQDINRALALDPDLFQAYLSRAAFYGMRKQYTKAILNCNEAIRLQPTSIRGFIYRGSLKYYIKAYDLAIRDLTKAIAIDSTCALAYFNRAVCCHDSGKYMKALQDYSIVLLLGDFLSLKVLINRGFLYYKLQDYRNSLQDFLQAANINPDDKNIHHTLGLCYHKLNRLEDAVKSFTKALGLDQFFLDALIGRGNVFMDYGHENGHTRARHDYERAIHLNPHCLPARVNIAFNLQTKGKFQQAWHQFSAAIALDNQFKAAYEGRAIINLQMSDTFAAFQDVNQAVNIEPTAELLTNRGVVNQFMGDQINAIRDYQHAIQLDDTYSLAYFNGANIYFQMRQFKQALEYFNFAIKFNERDESAYLNRGITKVMLRDFMGAMQDFDAAIKISPLSAHIYFNRGNLYSSLLKFDLADKDYTKALELCPDDPLVLMKRADARGALGLRDSAITDYKLAIMLKSKKRRG